MWFAGCADPRTQLLSTRTVQARRRRGPGLPAPLVGQAAGHPHRRRGPHRQPRGHPRRAQPGPRGQRQGRPHRPRRRGQRALRLRRRRRLRRPRPGPYHRTARHRYAARAAVGRRPAARSRPCAARGSAPTPRRRAPTTPPPGATARRSPARASRRALTRTFLFPETPNASQLGLTQTVGAMEQARAAHLRRAGPRPDPRVRPRQPRHHASRQLVSSLVAGHRPERVGADDRAQRPAVVPVPDGDRARRHRRLPARLRPRPRP